MSTAAAVERMREASPRLIARIAGSFYLLAILVAVFAEFIVPGRLAVPAAIAIPVLSYAVVTLLLYAIFRPVSPGLALLAVGFQLVGLAFEALRLQPRGVNVGMTFHGLYCLLIGYLIFRSTFMPRFLGVLMAFAGLVWLVYLSAPLAKSLSPYNSAVGLVGEGLPMLWLLLMGVNAQRWKEQATTAEEQR
ncbi:MAG TPA: DUF4386 domain-containing protein [Silvibacterium sp.]|nr:DUF4386 domain-containing protein [Silvibacterium sp.]